MKELANSQDGRAVKELLKIIDGQQKHVKKMKEEWQKEETAWQEKTRRLQEQVDRKVEQARGGQISVTEEEDDWLGLTEK